MLYSTRLYIGIRTSSFFALSAHVLFIKLMQSINDNFKYNLLTSFISLSWSCICYCSCNFYDSLQKNTQLSHRKQIKYRYWVSGPLSWIWYDYLCFMFHAHDHLPQSSFLLWILMAKYCVIQQLYNLLILHSLSKYL